MSVDRYTTICHLTPTGWVFGADGMYLSAAQEKENTPADRLLSLKYETEQSSQYSRPDYDMRVIYFDVCRYADIVRAILTHGLYPDHGHGREEPAAAQNNNYMAKNYRHDVALATLIAKCPLSVKEKQTN